MNPKLFWLITAILLVSLHRAEAQQPKKIPRIGVVSGGAQTFTPTLDGLRRGLGDLGYFDGKNIIIEYRYAEGKQERVPSFVAEFVRLNVNVIVVGSSAGIRAAKQITDTTPVVMISVVDPVAVGTVESFARPGRN